MAHGHIAQLSGTRHRIALQYFWQCVPFQHRCQAGVQAKDQAIATRLKSGYFAAEC